MITSPNAGFNYDSVAALAAENSVPTLDLLFIAANMHGVSALLNIPRARMQLKPRGSSEVWQLILPLENNQSPFKIDEATLYLGDEPVAEIAAIENDDVVLTYLRAGGASVTLNTNARSNCVGCIFCPNIIEDAADATVRGSPGLESVLRWLCADMDWPDLSHVQVITVCSGCFRTSGSALRHMADLRVAAGNLGFGGKLHLLSSVVRSKQDIECLAARAGPFHLTLTMECFERRNILLKSTKASLTLREACRILEDCNACGVVGDFTYVAGLDSLPNAIAGLQELYAVASTFPRIQVYQAHNEVMRRYRNSGAAELSYYIEMRKAIEPHLCDKGLLPRSWENYRPLWYERFADCSVPGPRI